MKAAAAAASTSNLSESRQGDSNRHSTVRGIRCLGASAVHVHDTLGNRQPEARTARCAPEWLEKVIEDLLRETATVIADGYRDAVRGGAKHHGHLRAGGRVTDGIANDVLDRASQEVRVTGDRAGIG